MEIELNLSDLIAWCWSNPSKETRVFHSTTDEEVSVAVYPNGSVNTGYFGVYANESDSFEITY